MDWQEKLSKEGHRISAPRRRIMGLLDETRVPLSPAEIHKLLREGGQTLGLASVYRTLDLMAQMGLLCQVFMPDGSLGYMANTGGHHHHLLCQKCRRSVEFAGGNDLDELSARVQAETGFRITDHLLQFYGLCPACAAKD